MYKAMFALNRASDVSFEAFQEHWETEHAELAIEGLPNLEKYTISFPTDADRAPYDGVAELYFASEGAMWEALDSEAMDEVEADIPNFAEPGEGLQLFVEERVQLDRT